MKTVPIYCFILMLFINGLTFAQIDANKNKLKKALKEAETYLALEEYHYVEEEMLEAIKYAPDNILCHYYLGIAIFNDLTKNRTDALPYFEMVYRHDKNFRQVNYWLGKTYQLSHQFTRAEEFFDIERKRIKDLSEDKIELEEKLPGYLSLDVKALDRFIDQSKRGSDFMAKADNKNLLNLSIANTYLPDITPIITVDGQRLYFTSHRQDITSHHELDPHDQLPYQDVFYMDRREDGFWSAPKAFSEINTEEHDAAIALSSDGERLFLYRSVGASTSNPGDIFEVNDYSGSWSNPKPIAAPINSSALETHMSMSANGKVIIFTSNREQDDAQGGMDLYIIRQLPNGEWAEPQNMGEKINTSLNEESPYIHPNGKILYFSSQGHHSIGGYDVFKIDIDLFTGELGDVIQLNYPVNTASDDLFYVMSADGSESYFSSVREEGMGGYDIYCVKNNESNVRSVAFFEFEFETEDKVDADILVKLINIQTQEVEREQIVKANQGKLEWMHRCSGNYALEAYANGYLLKSDRFDFVRINKPTVSIKETYNLQKFAVNKSEALMNIYYDENQEIDLSLSSAELKELKNFIENHPNYSLEIVGHSSFNPEKSKLVLEFMSKTKAMEALEAMRTIGIDSAQLIDENVGFGIRYPMYMPDYELAWKNSRMEYIIRPKGYQKFVADCSVEEYDTTHYVLQESDVLEEVVKINENPLNQLVSELKQCSFLELVLTSEATQEYLDLSNEIFQYFEAEGIPRDHLTLKLEEGTRFGMYVRYKGANDYDGDGAGNFARINEEDLKNTLRSRGTNSDNSNPEVTTSLAATSIKLGTNEDLQFEAEIESTTITFSFDSKVINKDNDIVLNKIKEYLNLNITKSLKITGHTDSSGPDIYNEYLGMERAKSVAYFFRDIENPNRIYVDTQGEANPIVSNKTKEGRAKNRRVNFNFGVFIAEDSK